MNKKSKMIAAVMLLAVSAAGLILINYYNPQQEQEQHEPVELQTPGENSDEQVTDSCENFTWDERAKCYFYQGNLNKSIEVCSNLNETDRSICFQKIAITLTGENISSLNESVGLCNKMVSGWFNCYTSLASVVVKSDSDAAIFLCNLTSPSWLCYESIAYAIAHRGVNETLAVCRKIKDSSCYTPAAVFMAGNDSEGAALMCRECVNDTDGGCLACYPGVAKEVARYDYRKALDICNEGALAAERYSYIFSHMCQIDAAKAIKEINASASFEICRNLTGRNRASCYYKIKGVSNNTAHITEMCDCMIKEYGEDPNIMRYCENYI